MRIRQAIVQIRGKERTTEDINGMKRIVISTVLALALAGTTAFAAQNKNAPAKKPAAKTTAAATTTSNSGPKKPAAKKKHKKQAAKPMANSNAGGTMTGAAKKPTARKGNSNK
jgi:hypothetical protein